MTGLVLVAYDFLIYPSEMRPGPVGAALPMAAVLSFGTLLAIALFPLPIRIGGGVIAALVIGGVPRLAGRRALGKEGWFTRLLRDILGHRGARARSCSAESHRRLALTSRLACVFAVACWSASTACGPSTFRSLWTILSALVVGAVVAGGAVRWSAPAPRTRDGARPILLVLWYGGARRCRSARHATRRSREVIAEYAVFMLAAIAGLLWISLAHL